MRTTRGPTHERCSHHRAGPTPPPSPSDSAIPPEELDRLTDDIVAALKSVYDPEIPADIYELGLIYKVDIADDRKVAIDMTLTAPGCPVAGEMPGWVETAVAAVPGVPVLQPSPWCSIRRGTRAACRTRPASRSTCGEPTASGLRCQVSRQIPAGLSAATTMLPSDSSRIVSHRRGAAPWRREWTRTSGILILTVARSPSPARALNPAVGETSWHRSSRSCR